MYSPKTLYIQLANQCNNNCTTCIFYNNPEYVVTGEMMSDEVIEKILKNIKKIDTIENVFYGPVYGEAQLHPKFYEMVEQIKAIRPSIKIGFITNGKLINKKELEKFKGDDIYLSILGNKTNPDTYESITGLEWKDLRKNAELILKEGLSYAFYINVTTAADLEEVVDDLLDIPEFKAIYTTQEYKDTSLLTHISDRAKAFKRLKSLKKKYKVKLEESQISPMHEYSPFTPFEVCPCHLMVSEYMTILSNGDILVCPCDTSFKGVNGNILDTNLLKLFNNLYMNNIRMMMKHGVFPELPCVKNCSVRGKVLASTPQKLFS